MSSDTKSSHAWHVLDEARVASLKGKPVAECLAQVAGRGASPKERVAELVALAQTGRIGPLKENASVLRLWAADVGLRRIENTLIELDRVTGLAQRGQAILQAQALTRFLQVHIDSDIQVLTDAISDR